MLKSIEKRRLNNIILSLILILGFSLNLSGCGVQDNSNSNINNSSNGSIFSNIPESSVVELPYGEEVEQGLDVVGLSSQLDVNPSNFGESNVDSSENSLLENISVKFINVGQADSCVIVTPNEDVILIDTGESKNASEVIRGLQEYSFEDIDLMVLTHPHADHIGGAQTILNTFETKEVLMCSYVTTTKTFEGVLDTLAEQEIKTTQATLGMTYDIDGVHIEVVGVDSVPNDNNSSSVVLKVTYGTVDLIFTGDLEEKGEKVVLNNGFDLDAEVLKVGHHGSDTSTSDEFLTAVNPKIAIISVGEDNSYGHPADITLTKLKDSNIQYYRTDEYGDIILQIDGVNIVTVFNDSFEAVNARSFLFTPNIAEIQLEPEHVVVNNVIDVSTETLEG